MIAFFVDAPGDASTANIFSFITAAVNSGVDHGFGVWGSMPRRGVGVVWSVNSSDTKTLKFHTRDKIGMVGGGGQCPVSIKHWGLAGEYV